MSIPILANHDPSDVIGSIDMAPDRLTVRFQKPISRDVLFEVFSGCGMRIVKGTQDAIEEADIFEFSVLGGR